MPAHDAGALGQHGQRDLHILRGPPRHGVDHRIVVRIGDLNLVVLVLPLAPVKHFHRRILNRRLIFHIGKTSIEDVKGTIQLFLLDRQGWREQQNVPHCQFEAQAT